MVFIAVLVGVGVLRRDVVVALGVAEYKPWVVIAIHHLGQCSGIIHGIIAVSILLLRGDQSPWEIK